MIDLIKFYLTDKESFDYRTERKQTVDLKSPFNRMTGEMEEYPKIGSYQNMEVRLLKNNSFIKGTLHKLFNNLNGVGNQNYSDFSYCEFLQVKEELCEDLYIKPKETSITNLEFGLNINLPFNPDVFLDNMLLMSDFRAANVNDSTAKKNYREFKRSDYSFKIYNKSKQYKIKENVLRVELKITRKRKLHDLNIYTLEGLDQIETFKALFKMLMERFDKLLIIDLVAVVKVLDNDQMNALKNYINAHY